MNKGQKIIVFGVFAVMLFVVLILIASPKKASAPLRIGEIQAKLLIMDGDTVNFEGDLENNFIFILKKDGVFYTDTTANGFFTTDYETMAGLGSGHQREIRKRVNLTKGASQ